MTEAIRPQVHFTPAKSRVNDPSGSSTTGASGDRSPVEVYAAHGHVTITDQVFPRAGSDGVQLFAEDGSAGGRAPVPPPPALRVDPLARRPRLRVRGM